MTPDDSGRLRAIPDDSERLRMMQGGPTFRSRFRIYRIFANFTHHYFLPTLQFVTLREEGYVLDG